MRYLITQTDPARVPIDPFSGQPLRLKLDGKDLVLYSVGPDGTDDGGAPWNEATKHGDLVFRLEKVVRVRVGEARQES